MKAIRVKSFLVVGGPLDGHRVTQQYAGDDYIQFNRSSGRSHWCKEKKRSVDRIDTCVLVWAGLFPKVCDCPHG